MSGFIQLERSFFNTPEWKEERNLSDAEAMLYLIVKSGFEAKTVLVRGKHIHLQAGELIASVRFLAEKFSWSKDRVNRFLKRLTREGYISRRSEKGEGLIAVKRFIFSSLATESATENETVKSTDNSLIDNSYEANDPNHMRQPRDKRATAARQQ